MFSFPPEFPFVSARKAQPQPEPAPPQPQAAPEPLEVTKPSEPIPAPVQPKPAAKTPQPTPLRPKVAPHPERRKIKRDAMCASALLRVDGYHGPPTKIDLIDISIAGARFHCTRPLEIGEKAQVRLEVGPLRWTTRLRVVHCTRIDNEQVSIGCAFLRTELLRPWPAAA